MSRRGRRKAKGRGGAARAKGAAERPEKLAAPTSDYTSADGHVLTLRGSLTPATRRQYAEVLSGSPLSREDAWHRAVEFLFEHLAVRWEIAGVPIERQRELLQRFRVSNPEERSWIRQVLREHCAENFPDVQAP